MRMGIVNRRLTTKKNAAADPLQEVRKAACLTMGSMNASTGISATSTGGANQSTE